MLFVDAWPTTWNLKHNCTFENTLGSIWIILESFGIILESVWDLFRIILRSFWNHFGIVLESFYDYFEIIWGSFWNHFGIILELFGIILESAWDLFRIILGSFLNNFGIILDHFGCVWGKIGGKTEGQKLAKKVTVSMLF